MFTVTQRLDGEPGGPEGQGKGHSGEAGLFQNCGATHQIGQPALWRPESGRSAEKRQIEKRFWKK